MERARFQKSLPAALGARDPEPAEGCLAFERAVWAACWRR